MIHFTSLARCLCLMAGGLVLPALGTFADPVAQALALPDQEAVITRALRENPQLRAVRWQIERAKGRLEQAGTMENPELTLWGRSDIVFSNEGEYAFGASLSQAFPLAARLRHERAASQALLEAAQAEVEHNSQLIAAEAVAAWRDAVEAQARLELLHRQAELAQRNAEALQQAAEQGERSVLDADQAGLEALALVSRVRQAQIESSRAQVGLRAVLGLAEAAALLLPPPEPLPSAVSQEPALRADVDALPAVRGAAALANAAAAELAQARAQRYGDITVALDFEQGRGEDAPIGKRTDRYLGLSVSVPLPVWNTYGGRVSEYTAARRQAEAQLAAERYRAHTNLAAFGVEAFRAWEAARLVQQGLLPRAVQNVQRMEQGWQQGELDTSALLRARASLIDIELEALRLTMAFHRATDRHAAASGQLLTKAQSASGNGVNSQPQSEPQ